MGELGWRKHNSHSCTFSDNSYKTKLVTPIIQPVKCNGNWKARHMSVQLMFKFTQIRCNVEHWSPKEFVMARAAVGVTSVFLEVPQLQVIHAEGARKVLGVELLAHGVDAVPQDGLLALGTEGPSCFVVVQLAIGLALMLKEVHLWEALAAGLGGACMQKRGRGVTATPTPHTTRLSVHGVGVPPLQGGWHA